jgi:hypothetical protein
MTEQEIDIVVKDLKDQEAHAKRMIVFESNMSDERLRFWIVASYAYAKAANIIESQKGRGA